MNYKIIKVNENFSDNDDVLSYYENSLWNRMSHEEFKDIVDETKYFLQKFGINKRERVFLVGGSHGKWLPVFIAILNYGAIAVPVNNKISNIHLINLLNQFKPKLIFASKEVENKLSLNFSDINFPSILSNFYCDLIKVNGKITPLSKIPSPPQSDDPALIIYTSGTTGIPKGIIHTHKNIIESIKISKTLFLKSKTGDHLLNTLPFSHIFGLINGALFPYFNSIPITILEVENISDIPDLINKNNITQVCIPPSIASILLNKIESQNLEFSDVKLIIGGSSISVDILKRYRKRGIIAGLGYGMSETCGGISINYSSENNSVGKSSNIVKFKLKPVKNKIGELLISSPSNMSGIFGLSGDKWNELWEDGYLKSGDIAQFDEEENLFILGKKEDMIITEKGTLLFPDKLEEKLGSLDGIKEFTICNIEENNQNNITLSLVLNNDFFIKNGIEDKLNFLKKIINEKTKNWSDEEKIDNIIILNESLPRSFSYKVQRNLLKKIVTSKLKYENRKNKSQIDKNVLELFKHLKIEISNYLLVDINELTIDRPFSLYPQLDFIGKLSLFAHLQQKYDLDFTSMENISFENFYSFIETLIKNNSFEKIEKIITPEDKNNIKVLFKENDTFKNQNLEKFDNLNMENLSGYIKLPFSISGPLKFSNNKVAREIFIPVLPLYDNCVDDFSKSINFLNSCDELEIVNDSSATDIKLRVNNDLLLDFFNDNRLKFLEKYDGEEIDVYKTLSPVLLAFGLDFKRISEILIINDFRIFEKELILRMKIFNYDLKEKFVSLSDQKIIMELINLNGENLDFIIPATLVIGLFSHIKNLLQRSKKRGGTEK